MCREVMPVCHVAAVPDQLPTRPGTVRLLKISVRQAPNHLFSREL